MPIIADGTSVALEHIILATDFSPSSETAMAYAEALARRFASRLTVANVIDLSVASRSAAVVGPAIEQMRHYSAENLGRTINQLRETGLKVDGKAMEGERPSAAVVRLAGDENADLLVLGTHGRTGLQKFILGSFAQGVIHHCKCPVLTIGPKVPPLHTKGLSFETILFATDLHHQTAEKAAVALAFAQDSRARILLCHVIDHPPSDLTAALDQQFETEGTLRRLIPNAFYDWCSPDSDVEFGSPAEKILQLATRAQADLIVMGAKRSNTWFTQFVEGVAGHVIANASCPVMTVCAD